MVFWKHPKRFFLLIACILFLVFVGLLKTGVIHLAWFKIEFVRIESSSDELKASIQEKLPFLFGASLFDINPSFLIQSIHTNPWVDAVLIKKKYPHELLIKVFEKNPFCVLYDNNKFFWVDHGLRIIDNVGNRNIKKKFIIYSFSQEDVKEDWQNKEIIDIIDSFNRDPFLGSRLSEIVLDYYPYFKIYLKGDQKEIIFSYKNFNNQKNIIQILYQDINEEILYTINSIDLTRNEKAVVRRRKY